MPQHPAADLPPLSPDQLVKPRHFDGRMSFLFAMIFLPLGVHLPYFPLWLEWMGLDAEEIAIVLAVPMFLRVFTTPLITAFADRARDRVYVLAACAALSLVLSLGYFASGTFAAILVVSTLLMVVWAPHPPLADSIALSGVRRYASNYAHMRIWGSASFLAASFLGGTVIAWTGARSVPGMICAGLALVMVACLTAPRLGKPRLASPLSATSMSGTKVSLLGRYFVLCVVGAGVINASHGLMYGFASIYWKAIGVDERAFGLLWSAAVIGEVAMFMAFTRLLGHVPARNLLVFAGIGATLRWIAYPLVWPAGAGVAGFLVLQALHAVSTGLVLLGVQKLIAETVSEARTGAAQGVAFFANGLAMALVTLVSGSLYANLGGDGFFVMALVAISGAVLVAAAGRQPHNARGGGETSDPS